MFADFLSRLTRPTPDRLDEPDARLALAALLVRIARSDNDYAASERQRIAGILHRRYGLDGDAGEHLLQQAEALEAEAPDTVRFTRAIKDAVAYEDRRAVLQAMWSVVLADGTRSDEEDALLRLVASLLGISDRDSALARQAAAQAGE